ncbi:MULTISPECIES: DUF6112 family protein [Brevibacterium]|uniref:DUF6112 family protein n=1 Tax=Brevibacterium TaxID=1696 RepID=UPI00141FD36A|nr:DUF6112 family protein [Brevibacterium limosum]
MNTPLTSLDLVAKKGVDPGVDIDMGAPWMTALRDLVGYVGGTVLVIAVLGIFVGLIIWIVGKFGSMSKAQDGGAMTMLVAVAAAVIAGSATAAVAWFGGFELF